MYKNILLTGESGCGKSTLINKILDTLNINYSGYRTLHYFINGVDRGFYLHGYVETEGNFSPISVKIGEKRCYAITETFNFVGTEILRKSRKCINSDIILLDEIGVLENKAENFKREIFKTLDDDKLVLGVIKKKQSDFLEQILDREDSLVIDIEDLSNVELEEVYKKILYNIIEIKGSVKFNMKK